jgi:hypothetical protein
VKTIAPVGNIPAGVYDLNAELEHGFFLGTRMTRMTRIFLGTRMTRMTRIFSGTRMTRMTRILKKLPAAIL